MNEPNTPSSPDGPAQIVPPIAEDPTQHDWAQPEATEGSLVNVTRADDSDGSDQWSLVDKKPAGPPPMPFAVKVGGALLIIALLVGASWLGLNLGSGDASPSPSPTVTIRDWALTPPMVHGEWVRGEITTAEPAEGTERLVVTSTYSTGSERIALVLSRPESDINQYLSDAAIGSVELVGASSCGLSQDTDLPVCVQILDETGILVAGTDGQSFAELDALLEEFYAVLAA